MFNGILYILLTFKCGGRNMTYLGYRKHQIQLGTIKILFILYNAFKEERVHTTSVLVLHNVNSLFITFIVFISLNKH